MRREIKATFHLFMEIFSLEEHNQGHFLTLFKILQLLKNIQFTAIVKELVNLTSFFDFQGIGMSNWFGFGRIGQLSFCNKFTTKCLA
ncbi:hypothetical protein WQ54_27765 [Bacillus sp. SA1-12]|nr:hypothetical protein WQ54_27765 [Bacillus sp. SA1-12]